MSPTVHVLFYGRVLRGNVHGLPCDWGPGHRWVSVIDRRLATCWECVRAASRVAESLYGQGVMLPPPGEDDGEVE